MVPYQNQQEHLASWQYLLHFNRIFFYPNSSTQSSTTISPYVCYELVYTEDEGQTLVRPTTYVEPFFIFFFFFFFFKKNNNKIEKLIHLIFLNIFNSPKFFPPPYLLSCAPPSSLSLPPPAESHPPATIKTQPPSTGDHAAQPPGTSDLVFTQKIIPPSPSSLSPSQRRPSTTTPT
jgi:hypothetical protein